MATHSSILAWKIPWKEEPSGLQSIVSQRVGHDWAHTHKEFWKALNKSGTFYWKSIDHLCLLNRFISKHKTLVKRLLQQDFYVPESESLPRTNRRFQNQTYFLSHSILRVVFGTGLDEDKENSQCIFYNSHL